MGQRSPGAGTPAWVVQPGLLRWASLELDRGLTQLLARRREAALRPGVDGQYPSLSCYVLTLDPIRCTLCVKPGGSRVLTSGQNQLFPSRGYTAETYAKVMGGSPPSQPRIKPKCTLFVC